MFGASCLISCGDDETASASFTVSEVEADAGDVLTINGAFDPNGTYVIEINGVECTIIEITATSITFEVPANATSGEIILIVDGQEIVVGDLVINTASFEITVYDANSWTNSTTDLETIEGAEIKLYRDENSFNSGTAEITTITDESGTATLILPRPGDDLDGDGVDDDSGVEIESFYDFIMVIEKGNKSILKNGYIISGVFFCQSELDELNAFAQNEYQSDYQNGAVVGDARYADINGDGIINSEDIWPYGWIRLRSESDDSDGDPTPIGTGPSCDNKPTEKNAGYIGE